MTHFSDLSYLQRCALWVYMGAFLAYKVWFSDRFRCLHPKKILTGELRTIITIMYIFMLFMQASWDVVLTWIKYSEKYIVIPGTSVIVANPFEYWTEEHKFAAQAVDYLECVNLSMQTGVLILLQCFWNYLSNKLAKRSFMSSFEFKLYIFWAIVSMVAYPVLQYSFRKNQILRESVPLMLYSVEGVIIASLGIRSNKRFNVMIKAFRKLGRSDLVIERLLYFQEMNMLLSTTLCCYALSLGILSFDALTSENLIAKSKIATDFLMANCNICAALMWIVGIFIFHPNRTKEEIEADRSRVEEKSSLDNKDHTTIQLDSHTECTEEKNHERRRLSTRVISFIAKKRVADSTSDLNEPLDLLALESQKEIVARRISNSLLPVRTSSRANANIPENVFPTSLQPPQRSKSKCPVPESTMTESTLKVISIDNEKSFSQDTISTVSRYNSYHPTSVQVNSTLTIQTSQLEDTQIHNENINSSSEDVYHQNWLHQSPTIKKAAEHNSL